MVLHWLTDLLLPLLRQPSEMPLKVTEILWPLCPQF